MKSIFIILFSLVFSAISYSQNGKKIVYVSDDNPSGTFQVYTMNEDGSNKKRLTDMADDCLYPRWSRDGTKIVFNTEGDRLFYIDNANTENPDEPRYICEGNHGCFSEDNSEIFFNSDVDGALTIYLKELTNSEEPYIISLEGYSNQQVLSEDGSKLVFSAFYNGKKEILLIDLEDTTDANLYIISDNDDSNLYPDISSDNKKIVWASFDNNLKGTIKIFSKSKETALTKGMPSSNIPKFSPDNSKIAFLVIENTTVKLYTMNEDGSNKEYHSIKGGNIARYKWIDNNRIIYDAEDGSSYKIGIVDIKTGKSELLTSKGSCMLPDITK